MYPAKAIIAALSVQNSKLGKLTATFSSLAKHLSFSRKLKFAATPPEHTSLDCFV